MAFEFKLPELGENIEQAEIVKVLVKIGDKVEVDQILLEIETDKATVEVPSEKAGVVKSVNVKDGDTVKVGDALFTFEESGESDSGKEDKMDEKEEAKGKEKSDDKDDSKEQTKDDDKPVNEEKAQETKAEEEEKAEKKQENVESKTESESGNGESKIIEFKLPELGENIEEAEITKIIVSVGDKVNVDDILIEIETDKATVEVPAEFSGVIKEVKVKEGDKVKIGEVILIVESGSAQKEEKKSEPVKKETPKEETKKEETKSKPIEKKESETPVKKETTSSELPRKLDFPKKIAPAAPSVRRFAREIGIDINEVNGSGPGGRISVDDIKKFAKSFNENIRSGGAGMAIGIKREPLPDFSKWGTTRKESMSNVRKKTAEHLSYAWSTIPHVTQFDKADITEIEKLRKQFAKKSEAAGGKLTVTAILLKVISAALKVFPQFNSSVDMENKEIILKEYFNIGIAVDTEKGLIVPVIKDVDKKNILQLSAELTEISNKARDKKITIEDMQGGCFTISNLGGIGGTYFTPIVNAPEVAILGVSRGSSEPIYKDGEFIPRMMLPLSLSYDHRVIDGADAARFIRWVVEALEQPFLLSLEG